MNKLVYILLPLFAFILLACDGEEEWTLSTYTSSSPKREYQTTHSTKYKTKEECREAGILLTPEGGIFDCGSNCTYNRDFEQIVCAEVCIPSGPFQDLACRD
jgi:hypothetical protein